MRIWFALLVVGGCGRIGFDPTTTGTSLKAAITARPALQLADPVARIAFSTVDPDELHPLSLPANEIFALPDETGTLELTVTARDRDDRVVVGAAAAEIVAGTQRAVTIVLGDAYPDFCYDGAKSGDETAQDCGGSCARCAAGAACTLPADCETDVCVSGFCDLASGPPGWQPIAPMPRARIGMAAGLGADGRIYVFGGGLDDNVRDAQAVAYDAVTDTWTASASLTSPRMRLGGCAGSDGALYAVGGRDIGNTAAVIAERLVPGSNAWTRITDLPLGRGAPGLGCGTDGQLYLVGGNDSSSALARVESTDGSTAWAMRATLSTARTNLTAATDANGRIYAIGGKNFLDTVYYINVEAFDPSANTWIPQPGLAHPRSDLAAALGADGRIYVLGGYTGGNGLQFAEALRPGAATWSELPMLGVGRDAPAAARGPDGRVYIFGGRAVSGPGQASAESYGPTIVVSPAHASPGQIVQVSGQNFAASATVRIDLGGVATKVTASDAAGAFANVPVRVPTLPVGPTRLRSTDERSRYPVTVPFAIE